MLYHFLVVLLATATTLDAVNSGVLTDNGDLSLPPLTLLRPNQPVQKKAAMIEMAVGCGEGTKTCFGVPAGCIDTDTCDIMGTVDHTDTEYVFEMYGTMAFFAGITYVAFGLSADDKMGDDSVAQCVDVFGTPRLETSWNIGPPSAAQGNQVLAMDGVELILAEAINGDVHCQFTRQPQTTHNGITFDLDNTPYYLLLARGPTSGGVVAQHISQAASSEAILLSVGGDVVPRSKVLLRLHAAFMITAWIGAASIGMFLARYYKQTFVGSKMFGKDQWFVWHRVCMVTTWTLTMTAFILIFIEINGWSSANNPHAILGTCTTILAFVQPFMAALRPAPTSPKRHIFNWFHWLVGNAAHILGIVTIFFATKLSKAEVPSWLDWIIFSYVIFHVGMHLTMSILGFLSEKMSSAQTSAYTQKDFGSRRGSLKSQGPRKMDAPHSTVRKVLLGVYIVVVVLLTVAIVVIAAMAPIGSTPQKQ